MKRAALFAMAVAVCRAQDGSAERGAQLYRSNCAIPYCHGPEGTAGRAPRLAGHRYNVNGMFKVITWGIPGTGMPEFTTRLKSGEIADLVAYLMTLGGSPAAPAPVATAPPRPWTAEARAGRALFFDAARTGACGSCHELDGWGVPVGPDLARLPPERFHDLREVAARRVVTARPAGEAPFAAVVVERTDARVRVYDLTAEIPVLRSFPASSVAVEPGAGWRHARNYTAGELEIVAGYLRWLARPEKDIH
ncbi:MAG TPA: c-type cytochrome [Candidatus Acidoferrales bacterium]|nr:c-type cytochrome [Candidatus Acidoferrales bacterium]